MRDPNKDLLVYIAACNMLGITFGCKWPISVHENCCDMLIMYLQTIVAGFNVFLCVVASNPLGMGLPLIGDSKLSSAFSVCLQ